MSQLLGTLLTTVEQWRIRNPDRHGGVVLVWQGEVYG